MGRTLVLLIVISVLVATACGEGSDAPAAADPGSGEGAATAESVAAAAIDSFGSEFPRYVSETSVVRLPRTMDIPSVASFLVTSVELTTALVESGPFWEVLRVRELSGYWQVDMASGNGVEYFSGSIFFRVSGAGVVEKVDPSDVGATPTTSVS